jgi:hypothetical protein
MEIDVLEELEILTAKVDVIVAIDPEELSPAELSQALVVYARVCSLVEAICSTIRAAMDASGGQALDT